MPFETAAKSGQGFQVSMVHSAVTKLVKENSVQDQESDEQEKKHAVGRFSWDVRTQLGLCFA